MFVTKKHRSLFSRMSIAVSFLTFNSEMRICKENFVLFSYLLSSTFRFRSSFRNEFRQIKENLGKNRNKQNIFFLVLGTFLKQFLPEMSSLKKKFLWCCWGLLIGFSVSLSLYFLMTISIIHCVRPPYKLGLKMGVYNGQCLIGIQFAHIIGALFFFVS